MSSKSDQDRGPEAAAVETEATTGPEVVASSESSEVEAEAVVEAPPPAEVPPELPPPVTPAALASEAPKGVGNGRLAAVAVIAALAGGGLGVGGSALMLRGPAADGSAVEARIAALEGKIAEAADVKARLATAEKALGEVKPVDLSSVEGRLAKIEAAPALTLPADAAARLDALEAGAKARLEAARSSVADALATLPPGAQQPALQELAAKIDAALTATREEVAARTAGLDAELRALAGKVQSTTVEDLKSTVASTSERIAAEVDRRNAEIAAALDGLRQRLGGMEALRGEVDGLVGRLGGLESSNKEAKVDRGRIAETIDATRSAAESRVGSVENKLATLEAGAEAARKAQADAVLAVALADLKSAVDGGRPFRGEFEVVKRSAVPGTLALEALESFADKGVPSVTALRDGLPKVVRAMHEADETSRSGEGVLDRLMSHAGQIVRVRPAGESAGTDLGALVSKVEARMTVGDLAGALAAWKALPEGARKVSASWGAALEARVSVDTALAVQTSAVVSKLSQPR